MFYPFQTRSLALIKMSTVNGTKKLGTAHTSVTFQNSLLQIVKILDKDHYYRLPIIGKQIVDICQR